ncbi:hypothetical protein B0H67DRAFT_242090 [Lasiosphaeris hirsuta]|uniref:Uncharacterized protein n=1 Tax=Lasiosphaeris hirsuta TaxID=260670 RepID=A0AA40AGN8_9PEZI|nr:hypothetical protein B0H67DRAFT_242090 [Lasiosphaeris hirsuta]
MGVNVMLAHFHILNKGVYPFRLTCDAVGLRQLSKAADLDPEQADFVKLTSNLILDPIRAAKFKTIRDIRNRNDDLCWVSQLYEEDCAPRTINCLATLRAPGTIVDDVPRGGVLLSLLAPLLHCIHFQGVVMQSRMLPYIFSATPLLLSFPPSPC